MTAISLGAIALAVSTGSWFRPTDGRYQPSPTAAVGPSEQEINTAVTKVCNARTLVNEAGAVAGSKFSDDPNMKFIIAINTRLSSIASADYLNSTLDQNPAAPETLQESIRELISVYGEMTLLHLSDADQERLERVYQKLDDVDATVGRACE
ncbi:MAG: hypothetical protein WBB07_16465 [Mycobacterium sp.]